MILRWKRQAAARFAACSQRCIGQLNVLLIQDQTVNPEVAMHVRTHGNKYMSRCWLCRRECLCLLCAQCTGMYSYAGLRKIPVKRNVLLAGVLFMAADLCLPAQHLRVNFS